MIEQDRLKELLSYDPVTGEWRWLIPPKRKDFLKGQIAGTIKPDGYRLIQIGGLRYISSRLAFFYITGRWPKEEMDHKNRNRSDDRWENLREASSTENKSNTPMYSRNTSGYRGIGWVERLQKWRVYVGTTHIGCFDLLDEAIIARDQVALDCYKDFAFLNSTERLSL